MCPHPQNTVLGDCVLSKQGGAGSFCLLDVLIVIKLGAKAPKKSCCQAALSTRGSAGRPALCAEDGECRSCGEMEIMIEKVAQKWKIPLRMFGYWHGIEVTALVGSSGSWTLKIVNSQVCMGGYGCVKFLFLLDIQN